MRIGIVAGEASGDLLAAGLIKALKSRIPEAQFEGVAGPAMIEQGCKAMFHAERLSVMGLVEVLGRYRELSSMRRQLVDYFIANPPDVFIGIDAPDFNIGLEHRLKQAGIPTVHYVSPSIWAWRQYRVRKIACATDLILTLFPFEAEFYKEHDVPVRFVGHTLADMIPMELDAQQARIKLGVPLDHKIIALLPGSRVSEVGRLADDFVKTAQWCLTKRQDLHFIVPLVNDKTRDIFNNSLQQYGSELPLTIFEGQSRECMAAADAVLLASGTAALEAMLLKRPMVVAYRLNTLNAWLAKRLLKVPYVSLPNLLAGKKLVDEYFQDEVNSETLGPAIMRFIDTPELSANMKSIFTDLHHRLKQDADNSAANAVLELLQKND
jgi:lipid-A-disaccharide synthase